MSRSRPFYILSALAEKEVGEHVSARDAQAHDVANMGDRWAGICP